MRVSFTKRHLWLVSTALPILLALYTIPLQPAFAQIVPDGGTETTVSAESGTGRPIVQIAPTDTSGTSHNTFTDYSVGGLGVMLDNRVESAKTILNEVTSNKASVIAGPTVIEGASAHFILANPNGITVNGARFENAGGVVLSTGKPQFVSRQVTAGLPQRNIILETRSGQIDVTGQGLGGAMTSLQLLAGRIVVDGPIENSRIDARSDIRLVGGNSNVEFDTSIAPDSNLEDWGRLKNDRATGEDANAVVVTARGSVKANGISIIATDKGAGVAFAGDGLASLGDFSISADGKVGTTGSIKAGKSVKITAGSVHSSSPVGRRQQSIEAIDGALTILAHTGSIQNTGALMRGAKRDLEDADSLGAVTLRAANDISLLTENVDQLAVVFGDKDKISITAGNRISNNTGRFLSNAETHLTAGTIIENIADIVGGDGEWRYEQSEGKRLWYTLWTQRQKIENISIDYGMTRVPGQHPYVVGSAVRLVAGEHIFNRSGFINANNGDLDISSKRFDNSAGLSGNVIYSKTCGLTCVSYGYSTAVQNGGVLNSAGDININASDYISNIGGQFLSYNNINLKASRIELSPIQLPSVIKRRPGLYNFWGGSSAWIGTTLTGGLLLAPVGSIQIQSFNPIVANAGSIQAAKQVIAPFGVTSVSEPEFSYPFGKTPIGLYRKMTGG